MDSPSSLSSHDENEMREEAGNDPVVARIAGPGEREEARIEEILTRKRPVKRRDETFVHMSSSSSRFSRTIIRRAGKRALRDTLARVKDLNKRKRHLPVLLTEMETLAKRTRNEIPAMLVPASVSKRNHLMGGKDDLELAIQKFKRRAAVTRKVRDYLESESAARYGELLRLRADAKDAEEEEAHATRLARGSTVRELSEMLGGGTELGTLTKKLYGGGGDDAAKSQSGATATSGSYADALTRFLETQVLSSSS